MTDYVTAAVAKLESVGAHPIEVAAFRRRLEQLSDTGAGQMPGSALEPLKNLPVLDELPEPSADRSREILDSLVVVKLNGGLGTSMGLSGAKSLLAIKAGRTFLDVIAQQVLELRNIHKAALPLVLMNSEVTQGPSLDVLGRYEELSPLAFLQGREPKLRADDLMPVTWPDAPGLEWCPAGHGDLYISISASGMLDQLLDSGARYAFISNSDNLGAIADVRIAAWMADNNVPFAVEAAPRTAADRKGGHLALRDGQVVLREVAQVPEGDTDFGDIERWSYFNTNNLWLDLRALKELQSVDPAAPSLPLIVNQKTVDPRDKTSTKVIQLETAMGAAVGSIPGAAAVEVPRSRFAPVKTTNELLIVRSDVYELADDGQVVATAPIPLVDLDSEHYKLVSDLDAHFPSGPPSLRECTSLKVSGDVTFGARVVVKGDVHIEGPAHIPDGAVLS